LDGSGAYYRSQWFDWRSACYCQWWSEWSVDNLSEQRGDNNELQFQHAGDGRNFRAGLYQWGRWSDRKYLDNDNRQCADCLQWWNYFMPDLRNHSRGYQRHGNGTYNVYWRDYSGHRVQCGFGDYGWLPCEC